MKKKHLLFNIITLLAIMLFPSLSLPETSACAYSSSQGEIVIEASSGRILHELDPDKRLPMASTTKIVTAITAIENADVNKEIVIPENCVGIEGSSVYLKSGERYTLLDLLYGLMLRSGNDCAESIAVAVSGSVERFAEQMNETAKKCGADNSNFTNPHGLPSDKHYTTAKDLALITRHAMENPIFRDIVSSKKYAATELNGGDKRYWKNKNKMLFGYDGANGVKTGYTKKAGRCLVSSAERNGMQTICVVLNSPQMFERSEELLDSAFEKYEIRKLVDKNAFFHTVFTEDLSDSINLGVKESFSYPVGRDEKIEYEIDVPERPDSIPQEDEIVGHLKIYCSKQLIFSENVYTLK